MWNLPTISASSLLSSPLSSASRHLPIRLQAECKSVLPPPPSAPPSPPPPLSPVANCHTSFSFSQDPKCFWNLAPFTHPAGGKHTHTDTDTDTRSVDRQSSTWGQAQVQWPEERTSTAGNLPRMDWTSRKNKHFSKYEEHLRILLLFLPTDFTPNIRDYWHQHEHEEEEKWTGHQLAQVHLHSGSVEKRYSPFHEKQNCYDYWKIESEKIQHDRRLWNFTHKWYSSSANRTASITWLRKS